MKIIFLLAILYLISQTDAVCQVKTCTVTDNMDADLINPVDYEILRVDENGSLEDCCQKCHRIPKCTIYGYTDASNTCIMMSLITLGDIQMRASNGSHIGVPDRI